MTILSTTQCNTRTAPTVITASGPHIRIFKSVLMTALAMPLFALTFSVNLNKSPFHIDGVSSHIPIEISGPSTSSAKPDPAGGIGGYKSVAFDAVNKRRFGYHRPIVNRLSKEKEY